MIIFGFLLRCFSVGLNHFPASFQRDPPVSRGQNRRAGYMLLEKFFVLLPLVIDCLFSIKMALASELCSSLSLLFMTITFIIDPLLKQAPDEQFTILNDQ